jgi:dihydrofolate reductase
MAIRCALIVAMAEDRVIGVDGGLPWRLSADLKRFKALTMGKPMIMGRKTYDSIGRPLPGRANIVVSGNPEFAAEGVISVRTVAAALRRAEAIAAADGVDEIMVIGGAAIYAATLPHADRIYLTEVHQTVDGDTRFPEFDRASWREVDRTDRPASGDAPAYSFVLLERPAG